MIGLSTEAKDEMLRAFAGRAFPVVLYSGDDEIVDAIYQRQSVLFSAPTGDGVRYVENVEKVMFEGFNSPHLIDHWGILDESGQVRARYRVIGEPIEVSPVMDCKFRPGELRIGLP